jgi:curved DNA-binding protein
MAMDYIDYYKELDLERGATKEQIQRQYKKLARKYHPDVNKEAGAEDRFKRLVEAYEVLKDPDKRKKYDRFGKSWKNASDAPGRAPGFDGFQYEYSPGARGGYASSGSPFGASGFSSFFESLFGADGARFTGGSPFGGAGVEDLAGATHEARVELSIEEAASGGKRQIRITDPTTGREKKLEVQIPKAVRPGQKMRLKGQGGTARAGGKPGDLLLVMDVVNTPKLRLEGNDLYATLAVTPWLAALGGEARLTTLTGAVSVQVPAGSSSGQKIRLRGKGYPDGKGGAGDLYAELRIMVPKELSEDEKKLFEQLRDLSTFKPE